jgi:hypothetical protein
VVFDAKVLRAIQTRYNVNTHSMNMQQAPCYTQSKVGRYVHVAHTAHANAAPTSSAMKNLCTLAAELTARSVPHSNNNGSSAIVDHARQRWAGSGRQAGRQAGRRPVMTKPMCRV